MKNLAENNFPAAKNAEIAAKKIPLKAKADLL
jgi:hypothetical protein